MVVGIFLLFSASRSGGRQRPALYHNFSTNAAPVNGSCSVDPTLGYADPVVTLFNVSCVNYTDPDLPLDYSLYFNYSGRLFKACIEAIGLNSCADGKCNSYFHHWKIFNVYFICISYV